MKNKKLLILLLSSLAYACSAESSDSSTNAGDQTPAGNETPASTETSAGAETAGTENFLELRLLLA